LVAILLGCRIGGLAAWLLAGYLVAWLIGRLVAWLLGCLFINANAVRWDGRTKDCRM